MEPSDGKKIRDATVDDAATIADIYNESVRRGDSSMDEEEKSADEVRRQIEGFGPREAVLLLEDGTRTLGWGVIKRYSDRAGYRFCCETSVYLRRDEIGKGYGPRIKAALIERCRRYGYHHLVARIMAENVRSIEYNLRFGYEIVGVQREIGFKDGRFHDVVILQLLLREEGGTPPLV